MLSIQEHGSSSMLSNYVPLYEISIVF